MKNTGWHNESKRHSLARQGVKTGSKITDVHKNVDIKVPEKSYEEKQREEFFVGEKQFDADLIAIQKEVQQLQDELVENGVFDKDDVEANVRLSINYYKNHDGTQNRHINFILQIGEELDANRLELDVMQRPHQIGSTKMLIDDWLGAKLVTDDTGRVDEFGIYFPSTKEKLINYLRKEIKEYKEALL